MRSSTGSSHHWRIIHQSRAKQPGWRTEAATNGAFRHSKGGKLLLRERPHKHRCVYSEVRHTDDSVSGKKEKTGFIHQKNSDCRTVKVGHVKLQCECSLWFINFQISGANPAKTASCVCWRLGPLFTHRNQWTSCTILQFTAAKCHRALDSFTAPLSECPKCLVIRALQSTYGV